MAQARSDRSSGRQGGWGIAWVFPIAAVVAGLAGGFSLGRGLRRPAVAPSAQPPQVAAAPAAPIAEAPTPSPAEAPTPSPAEAPTPPPAEAPSPAAQRPAPAPPATGAMAHVHIRSTPTGVQVARASDGEPLGSTPLDVDIPESDEPMTLLLWKKGYAPTEKEIVPRGELTVTVQMPARKRRGDSGISSTTTIDPFN